MRLSSSLVMRRYAMNRKRKYVFSAVILALAVGSIALSGCGTTIVSGDGTALRTITASGEGRSLAAPDTAEMTFGATASGQDPKAVLAEAGTISKAIVDAVKGAGVDADDIQTSGVSLYPRYDYTSSGKPSISGYEAQVNVLAKVRDVAKLGDVIDAASGAGATTIYGPSWSLSEDSEQADLAIDEAIADARRRAEAMASAVGESIGDVVTVTESSVESPIIYSSRTMAADATESGKVGIEPGNLEVTANVTVTFLIP